MPARTNVNDGMCLVDVLHIVRLHAACGEKSRDSDRSSRIVIGLAAAAFAFGIGRFRGSEAIEEVCADGGGSGEPPRNLRDAPVRKMALAAKETTVGGEMQTQEQSAHMRSLSTVQGGVRDVL
ncbi:hypothetical protein BURK_004622 [Burkholderia sp. SJ98]|nr:hypothetical protein BURK_004622 [Burkholderia sp. SJ98]